VITPDMPRKAVMSLIRQPTRDARPSTPIPPGVFRLLYADPPWRYEHIETESRAIENQYPTMDLDAICALPVPAADDAVLYLWATSPKLEEAMRVIDAWGFTYRTCAVWDKEMIGMGYYFRQQHELLLVAARGALPVPDPSARPSSVIRVKRGPHSSKPVRVYELLESMYPAFTVADRVELFSRTARPGWTTWSNEPAVAS
jgi:N6-adenosine-specific RNA methylase IME4